MVSVVWNKIFKSLHNELVISQSNHLCTLIQNSNIRIPLYSYSRVCIVVIP